MCQQYNTSDHLPILTKMIIKAQTETLADNVDVRKCFKMNNIDWKSIGCREKYCGALQRSLHNFNTDHTHVTTPEEGQALVNQLCDATEAAKNDACEVVNPATSNSTVTGGATRRTPWWTASTKIAKSRKTFWVSYLEL